MTYSVNMSGCYIADKEFLAGNPIRAAILAAGFT